MIAHILWLAPELVPVGAAQEVAEKAGHFENVRMTTKRRIVDDLPYAHYVAFSVYHRRRLLDHDQPKRIALGGLNSVLSKQQGECIDFVIYEEAKVLEKLTYMHENPVRAGLVAKAVDWRWSSARWYLERKTVGVPLRFVR